jgi:type VI secretion system protein ImpA
MPLRNDLLNPIPGDNPSGANLRYDPVTEKIKEARREDLDVPQGQWKTALKTADYPMVIKVAGDVLANRCKDLQIAVWLVDAHARKEGFAVLAPALQFLRDLLERFWDSLYPPIDEDGDMEVRAAPLVWLGAKLGEPLGFLPIVSGKLSWNQYQESRAVGYEAGADTYEKQQARETRINEGKITGEQFDEAADATPVSALRETLQQLTDAQTALGSLGEYCDRQFGDFSPSFIRTREAIEEIAQTVGMILGRKPGGLEPEPAPAEEPAAIEEPVWTGSGVTDQVPSLSGPAAPALDGPGGVEDVARQLTSICGFLRSRDPGDPTPYLILRSFAWAQLMNQAPRIDYSAIQAPPTELRVSLKRSTAESEWDRVLEATEAAMAQPCGRAWLDLQRYAVNALEQKGFPSTARVVNNQFRVLLEMLPDILEVTLPDDTPAANAETRNWIENFVLIRKVTQDGAGGSGEYPAPTGEIPTVWEATPEPEAAPEPVPAPVPDATEENPPILAADEALPSDKSDEFALALQAVREGRTAEGLGLINGILSTERSGRARFRRRTQLAHLLIAAGKGKVAQPILDRLAAEIEERRLEDWEQGEALAYPLELLLQCLSPADDERRAQLYARICRLDPVRAVNCL